MNELSGSQVKDLNRLSIFVFHFQGKMNSCYAFVTAVADSFAVC